MEGAVIVMVPNEQYVTSTIDPHVTLAYFGKAEDLQPWEIEIMKNIASDIAQMSPRWATKPKASGRGYFHLDPMYSDGNKFAYIDLIDWNVFPKAREEIETRAGFSVNRGHGFIPHMTIAYSTEFIGELVKPTHMQVFEWASVDVWLGDERFSYPV